MKIILLSPLTKDLRDRPIFNLAEQGGGEDLPITNKSNSSSSQGTEIPLRWDYELDKLRKLIPLRQGKY